MEDEKKADQADNAGSADKGQLSPPSWEEEAEGDVGLEEDLSELSELSEDPRMGGRRIGIGMFVAVAFLLACLGSGLFLLFEWWRGERTVQKQTEAIRHVFASDEASLRRMMGPYYLDELSSRDVGPLLVYRALSSDAWNGNKQECVLAVENEDIPLLRERLELEKLTSELADKKRLVSDKLTESGLVFLKGTVLGQIADKKYEIRLADEGQKAVLFTVKAKYDRSGPLALYAINTGTSHVHQNGQNADVWNVYTEAVDVDRELVEAEKKLQALEEELLLRSQSLDEGLVRGQSDVSLYEPASADVFFARSRRTEWASIFERPHPAAAITLQLPAYSPLRMRGLNCFDESTQTRWYALKDLTGKDLGWIREEDVVSRPAKDYEAFRRSFNRIVANKDSYFKSPVTWSSVREQLGDYGVANRDDTGRGLHTYRLGLVRMTFTVDGDTVVQVQIDQLQSKDRYLQ